MPVAALAPASFHGRTYPLRIHAGRDALAELPRELQRASVSRAVLLCGHSVYHHTPLIARIEALAGEAIVGVFPGIREGAPGACIEEAVRFAQALQADALIAVGAGSVVKGARVVAMALGQGLPLEAMATQHEAGRAPRSRRLPAPKVPIFNVLTSPTSAQNRGGSAVRYEGAAHQLEFFDPKTRPWAVFWDDDALATAPASLLRSTCFEIYWWALMCMGTVATQNPLVQASRHHAWALARAGYDRLGTPGDGAARRDFCAAALLQNRDEEDGGRPWSCHLLARAAYACAVAVFNRYPGVTQSHGYAGFAPAMIRTLGHLCPEVLVALARTLGMDEASLCGADLSQRVAATVEADFAARGWQGHLGGSGIGRDQAGTVLEFALRNYNANHDLLLTTHREALHAAIAASLAPER